MKRASTGAAAGGVALLALSLGCVGFGGDPLDALLDRTFAVEETSPLGGDSLAGRRLEMRRAHRDMVHFVATLEALRHRRDRNGTILFRSFLDAYMGTHLDPLLSGDWQSEHPELLGLDASLRLVQAEVFLQMRDPRRLQRALDEMQRRYAGRQEMLVEFPAGQQSTLGAALERLRRRKWRG